MRLCLQRIVLFLQGLDQARQLTQLVFAVMGITDSHKVECGVLQLHPGGSVINIAPPQRVGIQRAQPIEVKNFPGFPAGL